MLRSLSNMHGFIAIRYVQALCYIAGERMRCNIFVNLSSRMVIRNSETAENGNWKSFKNSFPEAMLLEGLYRKVIYGVSWSYAFNRDMSFIKAVWAQRSNIRQEKVELYFQPILWRRLEQSIYTMSSILF